MRYFVVLEEAVGFSFRNGSEVRMDTISATVLCTEKIELASMFAAQINKTRLPGVHGWLEAEL